MTEINKTLKEGVTGWRKVAVVSVATTVGIALSYFGKLDTVTSDFLIYMSGLYVFGNVGEHVVSRFKKV